MAGRLAIDFGTSNTVVATWDAARCDAVIAQVPDYGRLVAQAAGESVSYIPSLIHYAEGRTRWIGNQVLEQGLGESGRTFRWMKRYIANRSPRALNIDGRQVSFAEAGRDFLATLLLFATEELVSGADRAEVGLSVPVEAFEHYENWLAGVAEAGGLPRFRLIDEPSAAALGYGAHIQPGNVYLVFDFGGGTLGVAVVLIQEDAGSAGGRQCRVLGKAGAEIGGASIDQWLFAEVLRQNGRTDADEDVRRMSRALLRECEAAKEQLSHQDSAAIRVVDPLTGSELAARFTQNGFEAVLDAHDMFAQVDRTIRRALAGARELGYGEDEIRAALMVGGSSLIPSMQRALQRIFGRERVMLHRPMDAVARGAAAFVAGVDFYDHIQHDYAIRYVSTRAGEPAYHTIVRRGTLYPTIEPVSRLTIKATHDGQTQLGIAIYEVAGSARSPGSDLTAPVELVFDPSGAARLVQPTAAEAERRSYFWMNEGAPTFLPADPPAMRGEARFAVEFSIDANKRLLVTARDLRMGTLVLAGYPVVKLT